MFAKEAQDNSAYKMNTEIESDTEEWHRRKQSTVNKTQPETSKFRNEFSTALSLFEKKLKGMIAR